MLLRTKGKSFSDGKIDGLYGRKPNGYTLAYREGYLYGIHENHRVKRLEAKITNRKGILPVL